MLVIEAQLQASTFKVEVDEAKAHVIKEEVKSMRPKEIEDYKKSKDFEDEVVEGSLDAYKLGFVEYKKRITKAFLALDLSNITDAKPKEEEEAEAEEGREWEEVDEEARAEAEVVGAEEVIRASKVDLALISKETMVEPKAWLWDFPFCILAFFGLNLFSCN